MEKNITIGVAGHVDHGKTSLVKALTGIDTDRLQEEKRRGLSIESGIAPMELSSGGTLAFVDVPGHTGFMKNTIRGLSSVDAAVLVVAADDGIMPQTREHLEILRFLGAETGFVVLSKADLVDDLCLDGSLIKVGGGYQAPHVAGNLSKDQEDLIGLLLDFAAKSGLNPFSADTVWKRHERKIDKKMIQKHLDYLKGQGKLAILGDKRFLSIEAVEEAKRRVGDVIKQKGVFKIGDCKEALGYGRTVAIPVLEYLDTIGFTRREGDVRVLMKNNQQGGNNHE